MSGETEGSISAWTVDSLKEYIELSLREKDKRDNQRYDAQEKALAAALLAAEKAVTAALSAAERAVLKAEAASERRFESVNEFRAQQGDLITTFARRDEMDTRLKALTEKIDGMIEAAVRAASTCLPRAEYDRAHVDLAERVIAQDKTFSEKLESQNKSLEARIALLQTQIASLQAVTG